MRGYLSLSLAFLALTTAAVAQSLVTGVVRNSRGVPVPGATVEIRRTGASAVSDANGNFSIAAPRDGEFTVVVGSPGFDFQNISLRGQTQPQGPLEISLAEARLLDKFLVTSRRRTEPAQSVPIPISVVAGSLADNAQAYNVNRL